MKAVIFSGGRIEKEFVLEYMYNQKYDYIIAVDKGLEFCYECGLTPNIILGDFDSVENVVLDKYLQLGVEVRKFNPMKDLTDTQIGIEYALEKGAKAIDLFGATGNRLDHVLGNINALCVTLEKQVRARIIDENNRIQLINKNEKIIKTQQYGKYVSFIPLGNVAKGVTLKGFKYPLKKYDMTIGNSLGISNEIVDEVAEIEIQDGILIMVESRD